MPWHLRREFRRILYSEYLQRALLPALTEFSPHIIYERYSLFSYAGVELARALGVPLVLEVNAPLALEAAQHRDLILKHTAGQLEAAIWCGADVILVVSEMLEAHAASLGVARERIEVVRTGVDCDLFDATTSGDGIRERHGLSGKKVVGFVGSLKPWHDLDTLIAAMARLVANDPTYQLLVVGQGPRTEELTRQHNAFVTDAGAVKHEAVPAYLAAMDVVTVPYAAGDDHYFSPIKLFEAMAMAKPVVGARIGQVANVLAHNETGLLYEPGNAADLVDAIGHVFTLPDKGAALGRRAREAVAANYTWRHVAERIVAVAEGLLAGART
jgi:glycosyltransferase involved in cell wall biosynthesis